jgi:hypothetical protein
MKQKIVAARHRDEHAGPRSTALRAGSALPGLENRLEQFEPGKVLRINNPDRHVVVIDHDQVVDAMAFE